MFLLGENIFFDLKTVSKRYSSPSFRLSIIEFLFCIVLMLPYFLLELFSRKHPTLLNTHKAEISEERA